MKAPIFLLKAILLASGLCLLAGCVRLGKNYPEKHLFLIQASYPGEASSALTDEGLRVLTFSVSPLYEGKGFVYRRGDNRVEADFYNEFFLSPSTMLTEEVRQWMAGSGLFSHMADLGAPGNFGYFLEGHIASLYGDYRNPSAPKAVLEMEFLLTRRVSPAPETVLRESYRQEIPLSRNTPQALVDSWNKALKAILMDFEEDLKETLQRP
jgi:cholesterol transport system auxiliary component